MPARAWTSLVTGSQSSPARVRAWFRRPAGCRCRTLVDPTKFDFYAMDCYRHLAEDRMAETLADEVIRSSTDFDGTERAPMRTAEARITLAVVAARQGDIDQAIACGDQARTTSRRKSQPSP